VERFTSELIELSTRHYFPHWLAFGTALRGWTRSVSGDTAEGLSWIEDGIEQFRAAGSILGPSFLLSLKAESLHLADRTSEALAAITEAEALAERFEQRASCAELYRLRGVFLAAIGAEETQIEASFCEAIRIAREQKSVSLEKTRQRKLRRIPPPKSERVRRAGVPTTSLLKESEAAGNQSAFLNRLSRTCFWGFATESGPGRSEAEKELTRNHLQWFIAAMKGFPPMNRLNNCFGRNALRLLGVLFLLCLLTPRHYASGENRPVCR